MRTPEAGPGHSRDPAAEDRRTHHGVVPGRLAQPVGVEPLDHIARS